MQIGSFREENVDLERGLQINREAFLQWIERGACYHEAGEGGFPIAARANLLFESKADGGEPDAWNQIRAMAASTFDRAPLRAASSLVPAKLAVLLHV